MKINFLAWGKILFLICLFVLFFYFFGLDSLKRYLKYEVVVLNSEKQLDGIPVPSVTFCARNPNTGIGFQKNYTDSEAFLNGNVLDIICKNSEPKKCIEDETFNMSTVITSVSLVFYETDQKPDRSLWTPHYTWTQTGLCYTYNSSLRLGSDFKNGIIFFGLNEHLDYIIFVHDPNVFVLNFNPDLPMTQISMENKPWQLRRMQTVQHERLNVPTKPCNTDPGYSFTGCVRNAISRMVGCRLPWDQWTSTNVRLCTTMDQFR